MAWTIHVCYYKTDKSIFILLCLWWKLSNQKVWTEISIAKCVCMWGQWCKHKNFPSHYIFYSALLSLTKKRTSRFYLEAPNRGKCIINRTNRGSCRSPSLQKGRYPAIRFQCVYRNAVSTLKEMIIRNLNSITLIYPFHRWIFPLFLVVRVKFGIHVWQIKKLNDDVCIMI